MSSPPRFSIVIPTHNRADLVVQAVRSVLDQTVNDFELIELPTPSVSVAVPKTSSWKTSPDWVAVP